MEAGVWGKAHARVINLDDSGMENALPLGGLRNVSKVYIYLNADAVLLLNGRTLKMRASRHGYWEFLADVHTVSLAIWTDRVRAQGKYVVFGES